MRARMKDNLLERYNKAMPGELDAADHLIRDYVVCFLNKIQGKIVELVFTGDDAFEKEDNNILLTDELWEKI